MEKVEIKRIADSLSTEEKTIIRILGKYQGKYPNLEGMPAGKLEREASRKIQDARPILRGLMKEDFIKGRDLDFPEKSWDDLPVGIKDRSGGAEGAYRNQFVLFLMPSGHELYEQLPMSKSAEQPKQKQYVELNLAERTLTIGTDTYRLTSQNEWDFLKTLASNAKTDSITPRMDGSKDRKNAVDTLRRRIGKDRLHEIISFSNDGYFLSPSVKSRYGSQVGIHRTHRD